ncbi:tetratricopeptide repeat protein [candidate division KSB1 bacterium]|nr:tetratricopeptide repeat protein [candidate division KSB1 bacterium]
MEAFGLNNEILVGGKKFHVQTNYLEPAQKVTATVYENGKIILKKEVKTNETYSQAKINEIVEQAHKEMIEEIELLFYISEKVRTIRHANSNNKLGIVFSQHNLFEEAIQEFKNAIEIEPELSDAYKNLCNVYLKVGDINNALDIINDGIQRYPDYPDFHVSRGNCLLEKGDYAEAMHEFNSALEMNDVYYQARLRLVIALLKSLLENVEENTIPPIEDRKELIINHLQKIERYIDSDVLLDVYQKFDDLKYKEMYDTLTDYQHLLDEKIDLEHLFYLKFMFGGKGKDDQYIGEYVQALSKEIEKNPQFADYRNNLGVAYLIQCRNLFLNALDEFRQALKINPNFKKAEKNLKLAENDGKGFLILLRAILK